MTSRGGRRRDLPPLPTIAQCETALDLPTALWQGQCYAVALGLIESGLVPGEARYGYYYGPVAPGGYFSATARLHRHGWVELPGGELIVDPTKWVFQGREPYLFRGPYTRWYDPGMQRLHLANLRPPPGRMPDDAAFDLALSAAAAQHLSDMTGHGTAFGDAQLFWIANLPLCLLGMHCGEIFREIARVGKKAYIPIDNWRMATGPGGPPAHVLRNPFAD